MLQPYTIALHVYAENEEEAKTLEADLLEFVKRKYNNGIYVRAAAMSRIIRQYGGNALVNAFIK